MHFEHAHAHRYKWTENLLQNLYEFSGGNAVNLHSHDHHKLATTNLDLATEKPFTHPNVLFIVGR